VARELFVLSAGAAKAVVQSLQASVEAEGETLLRSTFGAVGAMRDAWAGGAPCDVIILSAKLLDELARDRAVDAASRVSLGRVSTGVAVRAGAPLPAIGDGEQLKQTFLAATALYLPDPERATAGIHCVDVLRRLGILAPLQTRLRAFPSGAVAMSELARCDDGQAIGCTQVTEILYSAGVVLAGSLPRGFELNTEYAAAVVTRAGSPELAGHFVKRLASAETLATRRAGGFEA
jgi:molybdate transport system substrate-binding protein